MAGVYNEERKYAQYWIHMFKNGFAGEIALNLQDANY